MVNESLTYSTAGLLARRAWSVGNPPPFSPSLIHKGGGLWGWVILSVFAVRRGLNNDQKLS
jgi:hypothetical protein